MGEGAGDISSTLPYTALPHVWCFALKGLRTMRGVHFLVGEGRGLGLSTEPESGSKRGDPKGGLLRKDLCYVKFGNDFSLETCEGWSQPPWFRPWCVSVFVWE